MAGFLPTLGRTLRNLLVLKFWGYALGAVLLISLVMGLAYFLTRALLAASELQINLGLWDAVEALLGALFSDHLTDLPAWTTEVVITVLQQEAGSTIADWVHAAALVVERLVVAHLLFNLLVLFAITVTFSLQGSFVRHVAGRSTIHPVTYRPGLPVMLWVYVKWLLIYFLLQAPVFLLLLIPFLGALLATLAELAILFWVFGSLYTDMAGRYFVAREDYTALKRDKQLRTTLYFLGLYVLMAVFMSMTAFTVVLPILAVVAWHWLFLSLGIAVVDGLRVEALQEDAPMLSLEP